jgi:hypothetical protein
VTVGGSLEAILTSGDKDQYKHLVIVLAAHECEAVTDVQINGESLGALSAGGFPTAGKFVSPNTVSRSAYVVFDGTGTGHLADASANALLSVSIPHGGEDGDEIFPGATLVGTTVSGGPVSLTGLVSYTSANQNSLVRVKVHLGAAGQAADATLLAECPTQWSATDKFSGLCYIVVRLDLNQADFQGGPPNITATVKGRKVYDHRTAVTAWSANPALCVADFLQNVWGKSAAFAEIQWDSVDAAANACDEVLVIDTWTGPRYTCNGSFRTDGSDSDHALEDLLASMAGWADGSAGWRIGAGVWTAPVATLLDDDNAGPVQIVGGEAIDDLFNGVRGQFADPARGGIATDFAPYQNAAYVAADGRELWTDITLPYTNDETRSRNLARVLVEGARGETLSYPAKIAVVNRMRVGDRVAITCATLGIAGTYYRLQQRQETPGREVMLTFKQDVAANYDTVDASSAPPSSFGALPDPYYVAPPVGLAVQTGPGVVIVIAGTVVPRILVSVTGAALGVTDQLEVQWRTAVATDWQLVRVPVGQQTIFIDNVDLGSVYLVQARWYRPTVNAYSDWVSVSCQVEGKTAGPAPFDTFTVTVLDSGWRRFAFGYTVTAQPVDWQGAEIRYVAGTVPVPDWNTMTALNAPGQPYVASPVDTNIPAAGTWTFACRSRDSGGLSTLTVLTVTLGSTPAPLYVPDLTAPIAPTGVVLTAGLTAFYVQTDVPSYTTGHGHMKAIVYGKEYVSGPLPVFSDARPLAEFSGATVGVASATNTTWRVWVKWESLDGVLSAAAGGTNGFAVTTLQVATGDIGNLAVTTAKLAALAVTAAKLAAGAVADTSKFAAGIEPVSIVSGGALPTTFSTNTIFYAPDGKLYRWNGAAYVKSVDGGDIIAASIVAGKIAAGAIGTTELAAQSVIAAKLTVTDFTVLADNPDFEAGDTAWTKGGTWAISNVGTANAFTGAWVASIAAPGADVSLKNNLVVPVNENDQFYAECWVKNITGGGTAGAYVRIRGLDSGGLEVWSAAGNTVTAGAWTKSLVAARVPTAAEQAAVPANPVQTVHLEIRTGAGTGTVRVDLAKLKRKVGANLVVDGAITAAKLTLVDFDVLADNMDFEAGDTSWTPSAAGWEILNLTSLVGAGTSYQGDWGARIVAPAAISFLRNNLLIPTVQGEEFYAEAYIKNTTGGSGAVGVKLGADAHDVATGGYVQPQSVQLAGEATASANASATLSSGVAGAKVMIRGVDASGTEVWTVPGNAVATGAYGLSSVSGVVPAGVKKVHVQLACTIGSGTVYADQVRLMRKNAAQLIVDGAITAAKLAALAVTADKMAANSIQVGTIAVEDGAIVNAHIGDAEVDTLKIGLNAVTVPVLSQSSTITSGTAAWQTILSGTINLPEDGTIAIMFTGFQSYGAGAAPWGLRMNIDGTDVLDTGVLGANIQVMIPFSRGYATTAGSHTVTMSWHGDTTMTIAQRTLILLGAMR